MKSKSLKAILIFNLLLALTALTGHQAFAKPKTQNKGTGNNKWTVTHPRVFLPTPGSKATAGYFELLNSSDKSINLQVLEVQPFTRVETHETVKENEQAKMVQVDQFSIKSKETLKLSPGGKHIMLFEPKMPLQTGQTLIGKLKIQDQVIEVKFRVIDRTQELTQENHHH